MANKTDRIGFRVPAELKQAILRVSHRENRSIAQICEVFLRAGVEQYLRDGHKFLEKYFRPVNK